MNVSYTNICEEVKRTVDLKKFRKNKGMTQLELANLVGVKRSTITMIETDETYKPSVNTAKKIAKILEFDWTLFFN